jgi:pyruvate formate lyase activating enzyme
MTPSDFPTVVPTTYWHQLDDGRVQCDLCPRFCRLHEGQRGFCFVRARHQDQIVLTTYGHSSGFCVDPIEKKPLHHFLPGTAVLQCQGSRGQHYLLPSVSAAGDWPCWV